MLRDLINMMEGSSRISEAWSIEVAFIKDEVCRFLLKSSEVAQIVARRTWAGSTKKESRVLLNVVYVLSTYNQTCDVR